MRGKPLIEVDARAVKALAHAELERQAVSKRSSSKLDEIFIADPDPGEVSHEYKTAMAFRVLALLDIINDERLKAWVRPSAMRPGHLDIADAVFVAAGTMPLGLIGSFDIKRFVRKVGGLAQAGRGLEVST